MHFKLLLGIILSWKIYGGVFQADDNFELLYTLDPLRNGETFILIHFTFKGMRGIFLNTKGIIGKKVS